MTIRSLGKAVLFGSAASLYGCASMPSMPGISADRYVEIHSQDKSHTMELTVPIEADVLLARQSLAAQMCWSGAQHSSAFAPAGRGAFVAVPVDTRRSVEIGHDPKGGGYVLLSVDGMLGSMIFFGVEISPMDQGRSDVRVFPVPADRQGPQYQQFVAHLLSEGTVLCQHDPDKWSQYIPK